MHEWAIAMSVIQTMEKWAKEKGVNIMKVVVSLPSLSMLDLDIMRDAFKILKKNTVLENSEFEVRVRDTDFDCRNCGRRFSLEEIKRQLSEVFENYGEENPLHLLPAFVSSFARCPFCGSHDFTSELSVLVDGIDYESDA
ncbi:MAG: hydrogenase/urease maturation nickel metallochaperone HypA [Archaeoglobaceae archaeon]